MKNGKRPNGREGALARAALAALKAREERENDVAASAVSALAPMWRGAQQGAIRLIDLERRARFARLAFETN